MKKFKHKFFKHPYIYSAVILAVLIVAGIALAGKNGNDHEAITVKRETFRRQVSVSGKVAATDSAELGFEQGGRIARINSPIGTVVAEGQIIASIENGDISAEILQKQANVEREEAELASLVQGTRQEQLEIDRQTHDDASGALLIALRTALLSVENTMLEDIDDMFEYGNSVNPSLAFIYSSYDKERSIETDRLKVTENIDKWKKSLNSLPVTPDQGSLSAALSLSKTTLTVLKNFSDLMISVTKDLYPSSSGLTQSQIDAYRSSANVAATNIASASNNIQTAETAWSKARTSLALSESGSTQTNIDAQSASLKAARADLLSAQARLTKTVIRAPFAGTVTRMDVKVGEIVNPNTSPISLMSNSKFKIESYVPEVHIAYIEPSNPAVVTLDAYGATVPFDAQVSFINPAETIRDGVSTYKVTLLFAKDDPRIRSGMTANVVITTLEKLDTIVLPRSAIIDRNGEKFAKVLKDKEVVEVLVTIGSSTSLGQLEIVEGLEAGDIVVIEDSI